MNKIFKRALSIVVAAVILLGMVAVNPVKVMADDTYSINYNYNETNETFTFSFKNSSGEDVKVNDEFKGKIKFVPTLNGSLPESYKNNFYLFLKIIIDGEEGGGCSSQYPHTLDTYTMDFFKTFYYIGTTFTYNDTSCTCSVKLSKNKADNVPEDNNVSKNNNDSSSKSTHSENPDKYPSELPGGSVVSKGATSCELKVHSVDAVTNANQTFLANSCAAKTAQAADIILTKNLDAYRALTTAENGSKQTVTWANIDTKYAGPVYAVVYNPTDKAYMVSGKVDSTGTAKLNNYILRPSSTVTMFKLK